MVMMMSGRIERRSSNSRSSFNYVVILVTTLALIHTVLCDQQEDDGKRLENEDNNQRVDNDPRRYLTKRSVRVCGVKLVDMMKKVCNHCYKTSRKQDQQQQPARPNGLAKREATDGSLRSIVTILNDQDDDDSRSGAVSRGLDALDVFIEKRWGGGAPTGAAGSTAADTRRPRQPGSAGIANKCCLNQCSYNDLLSYCCTTPPAP